MASGDTDGSLPDYLLELIDTRLAELFDEQNAKTIRTWLVSNHGRRPVVVVGSGFTRNARSRMTDDLVGPSEAPLWSDIKDRVSKELGLDASAYDAPTLLELYAEEFTHGGLHNLLLNMVNDERLKPGAGHLALFAYDVEAVVTTNQLDTVLDQNGGNWTTVTSDPDLAHHRPGVRRPQLIYLHGHRTNCASWIFTRSEYENVERTRPVLIVRVRQLLAQHPVLVVGYSLADPDFHQVYRQMSIDMRRWQPLGLALFRDAPNAAERRHWEKLGIRIAWFKDEWRNRLESAFDKFFSITTQPRKPLGTEEELSSWFRNAPDFATRWSQTKSFLEDRDRWGKVEGSTAVSAERDRKVWYGCLEDQFDTDVLTRLDSVLRRAVNRTFGAGPVEPPPGDDDLRVLPGERFRADDRLTLLMDEALATGIAEDLADWSSYGVDRFEQKGLGDFSLLSNLSSFVWRYAASKLPENRRESFSTRAARALAACHRVAVREGRKVVQGWIEEDAKAIGITLESASAGDTTRGDVLSPVQAAMRNARIVLMSATTRKGFIEAVSAYRNAGELVRRANDSMLVWLAAEGAFIAHDRSRRTLRGDSGGEVEARALRLQVERAREVDAVSRWRTEANTARVKLLAYVLKERQEQEDALATRGQRQSFSATPADLFRCLRDLEMRFAPPHTLQPYLSAFLQWAEIADWDEEFAHRFEYDVDGTADRIERILSTVAGEAAHRGMIERRLIATFLERPATATGWVARVRAFASLSEVLRAEDLEGTAALLHEARKHLGTTAETWRGWTRMDNHFAHAWTAWAGVAPPSLALQELGKYVAAISDPWEGDELRARVESLPWDLWSELQPSLRDELLSALIGWDRQLQRAKDTRTQHDGVLLAMLKAIAPSGDRSSVELGPELTARLAESVSASLNAEVSERSPLQSYVAHLHITSTVAGLAEEYSDAMTKALQAATRGRDKGIDRVGYRSGTLAALLAVAPSDERVLDAVEWFNSAVGAKWPDLVRLWQMNPGAVVTHVHYLREILKNTTLQFGDAQKRILELARTIPGCLDEIGGLADPSLWGDNWDELVSLVFEAAMGKRAGTQWGLDAVGFWSDWLFAHPREPVPDDLAFLREWVLMAVTDHNELVANQAVYAVAMQAARSDLSILEARRTIATLKKAQTDPRVSVCHGAGFAAALLSECATNDSIRAFAMGLRERMGEDARLLVQRQIAYGSALGRRRRSGHDAQA